MTYNEIAHEEEIIDFETIKKMKDLMSKAKPVLELVNNWKMLETFVDELNMQYEPPYTTIQEAFAVAQRLRKAIEEKDMDISEARIPNIKSIKVTASFGISEYVNTIKDSQELYKMADNALYEAKERGRNRVIVYSPQK